MSIQSQVNSGFSSPRINLSPFTKDFRGEEQYNESIIIFVVSLDSSGTKMRDKYKGQ